MKIYTGLLLAGLVWFGIACAPAPESPTPANVPVQTPGGTGTLQPYPLPGSTATLPRSTAAPTAAATSVVVPPTATRPSTAVPAEPTPVRLTLTAGAAPTRIESSLAANGIGRYTVRAEAGQKLAVNVMSAKTTMVFTVSGADGAVLKSAGVAAPNWSMAVPRTQDYFIAISTPDGSAATYTLQVSLQK